MLILNQNLNKTITENFYFSFNISEFGIYLIEIIASCKSWKQNWKSLFNDDDLAVKIDNIEFPKLNGKNGLLNGESAWNGNSLKGLKKTGIFILKLESGDHKIDFISNKNPFLQSVKIFKTENNVVEYAPAEEFRQAEDGNNRQWISVALAGLPLKELKILAKAEKRDKDSDDIKLIVDGEIQKNQDSKKFKNWYWSGSLDDGKEKEFSKELNFSKGLHYIELWADKMPMLNKISLALEEENSSEQNQQEGLFGKIALYEYLSNSDNVNFRSEPAINSKNIITEIKSGEEVEILEEEIEGEYIENLSNIWHKVKWNGKEGYILSSFIEISGQERNIIVEKIKEKSDVMGLDQKLMLAIAFQESKFKPFAVSYTGVKGLFQITSDALADVQKETGYEVADKFNFEQSAEAGLRYYKYIILPKFNTNDEQYLEKTIAAYNAGYNAIPREKNKKLVYKELELSEIKKKEAEKYTKEILKNYQDKDWSKKLLILLLILVFFGGFQLFHLKTESNMASAGAPFYQDSNLGEGGEKVTELYNIEDNTHEGGTIEKVFKFNVENKENLLKIKENRDVDNFKMFLNGREILSNRNGLKDLFLWNSDILVARFWGGQTVYNYLFDLRNGGAIIPFVSDGETYNFSGSAGGSWVGNIPIFEEVFIIYYEGGSNFCDSSGEIYKLYENASGLKSIKVWDMQESKDWCSNFNG